MPDLSISEIRAIVSSDPLPKDLAARREAFDRNAAMFPLPDTFTVDPVNEPDLKGEWIKPQGADNERVILFLHGGGYMFGSAASHRHLTAEIARAARMNAFSLEFRLAPEHPFPAPVEDAVSAYRHLIDKGFHPGQIAIVGDSAGGGLAVATLLASRDEGLPMPACCFVISPWVDMAASGQSYVDRADVDPMVSDTFIKEIAAEYLAGADPREKLASPIHADLRGLPPLLIHVGSHEVLLDDALALARAAAQGDVGVTLEIWSDMVHVWHSFHPVLTEGRAAIQAAAKFLGTRTLSKM